MALKHVRVRSYTMGVAWGCRQLRLVANWDNLVEADGMAIASTWILLRGCGPKESKASWISECKGAGDSEGCDTPPRNSRCCVKA